MLRVNTITNFLRIFSAKLGDVKLFNGKFLCIFMAEFRHLTYILHLHRLLSATIEIVVHSEMFV